ncbi:acyl-CoA thioesterase [Silvanigrella aquatica]|uniref:Thioesterase n=1 Tax=Silvanigrella aquatica TaxID=1915309 RepID=A0A1L4D0Y8_9BACT|nr:thioesterase family protein [Silvanigrella aquatica]APJ03882.1 hypothetical protein AXG55_08165 [Silvanigrella aquatica]
MNPNEKYYQMRIGDLNYGNHVGHDRLVTLVHDARCSLFEKYGLNELSIGQEECSLIVNEIHFYYKSELHFLDNIKITSCFFDLNLCSVKINSVVYNTDKNIISAIGNVKLVGFHFKKNKILKLPEEFKNLVEKYFVSEPISL